MFRRFRNNNNIGNSSNSNNNTNNNNTTSNNTSLEIQLMNAVAQNNISEVKRLLENDADINYIPSSGLISPGTITIRYASALNQAISDNNLMMAHFIVTYKDKQNKLVTNIDLPFNSNAHISPLCNLTTLCAIGRRSIDKSLPLLYLLLASGADLYYKSTLSTYIPEAYVAYEQAIKESSGKLAEIYLYEALLRGDFNLVIEIINQKHTAITFEKLVDYLLHSQEVLQSPRQLHSDLISPCLNMLQNAKSINDIDKKELSKIKQTLELNDFEFDNGFKFVDYPQCLMPYLKKLEKQTETSLASIIAELQYHRGLLSVPATNEQLTSFIEGQPIEGETKENRDERLAARKKIYAVEELFKFIDPKNREQALIEMRSHQQIVSFICNATVHKDLSKTNKEFCISLLKSYEDLPPLTSTIIDMGKSTVDQVSKLLSDAVNAITAENQKEIGELKEENAKLQTEVKSLREEVTSLHTKLDLLIELMTKPEKSNTNNTTSPGLSRKFLS